MLTHSEVLLKVSVGHTLADFVFENYRSFKNLKKGQERSLAEQNSNMCWMLKRHWLVTPTAMELKHIVHLLSLSHFHVTTGYPPDVLHDLLEGIVPGELALCFALLIKKKYFSLEELNRIIKNFPYKWKDKTNCPQGVPQTFASRKTIGGNAHKNWCFLRLLPLTKYQKRNRHGSY